MKPAIITILILIFSFAFAQEKPRQLSREKIAERVQLIQKQVTAEQDFLTKLLTPEGRIQLQDQSMANIKEGNKALQYYQSVLADTLLSIPDTLSQNVKKKEK